MSEIEPSSSLDERCLRAAARLVERYGWQLLLADQLARLMRAQLDASGGGELDRCGISVYCGALYTAASGQEGGPRQNLAYSELSRFLASVMRQRYPSVPVDQRDDVLQSALERVFRSFASCREATAFLAFAAYRLLDAVRESQRRERRAPEPLQRMVGEEHAEHEVEDTRQPASDARLLVAERLAATERFLQLYLQAHPLAAQQVEIQRLSLISDLDNDEIARRLGISLGSIYTARSRFTGTVQREPQWRKLANELGMLSDEP